MADLHRILNQTWGIRTISPFSKPLLASNQQVKRKSDPQLSTLENDLSHFLQSNLSGGSQQSSCWETDGTYARLSWIQMDGTSNAETNSCSLHLHVHVYVNDEPTGQVLLCFADCDDSVLSKFSFLLVRGLRTSYEGAIRWIEYTGACVVGQHSLPLTPSEVAHATALWTTAPETQIESPAKKKPRVTGKTLVQKSLKLTFSVPVDGLDTMTLTIPPVALSRLCRDIHNKRDVVRNVETPKNDPGDSGHPKQVVEGQASEPLPILKACACYFRETFRINIESFTLTESSCAIATLGCDGRCKPHTADELDTVLREIRRILHSRMAPLTQPVGT